MHIPRIAQPLWREGDPITLIGLIRSVDTVPVAKQDVFRVVVKDLVTRKRFRFDLSQDHWNGKLWIVPQDTGTKV